MKNKKSNIPIIFFVLGVFLVCSFALLTFFISDFKIGNSFASIGKLRTLDAIAENYYFYLSEGVPPERINSYLNVSNCDNSYCLVESISGRSQFLSLKKDLILFKVEYFLP